MAFNNDPLTSCTCLSLKEAKFMINRELVFRSNFCNQNILRILKHHRSQKEQWTTNVSMKNKYKDQIVKTFHTLLLNIEYIEYKIVRLVKISSIKILSILTRLWSNYAFRIKVHTSDFKSNVYIVYSINIL